MSSLFSGAGEESRTLDLNLGKVALYQLSYSRIITLTTAQRLLHFVEQAHIIYAPQTLSRIFPKKINYSNLPAFSLIKGHARFK